MKIMRGVLQFIAGSVILPWRKNMRDAIRPAVENRDKLCMRMTEP